MRAHFILLLSILTISQGQILASKHNNELINFLRSFLKVINEARGVEELQRCISNGDEIFTLLKKALEEMSSGDTYRLKVGLMHFFNGIRELLYMLSPCMQRFTILKKLEGAMHNIDIDKIIRKIIINTRDVFKFINQGKSCMQYGDYKCVGENIGKMICIFILNDLKAKEFTKGLADAINETEDVDKLVNCISEMSSVIDDIVEGLVLIMKTNVRDFIEGLFYLTKAIEGLKNVFEPCSQGFIRIRQLFNAIREAKAGELIKRFMSDPIVIVTVILDFIKALLTNQIYIAGKSVGNVLYRFFLAANKYRQLI